MKTETKVGIPEKEYLTIEQRKVVNWYRRVLQVRNTSLLVVDLTDVLKAIAAYKALNTDSYSTFFAQRPEEITALSKLFRIDDINQSALELFGYDNKEAFLSHPPSEHIHDFIEAIKILALSVLESRQHIEIEATACHQSGDLFKISIELIGPQVTRNTTKIVVSIAELSGADQLSIKQFTDENVYDIFVNQAPVCIHEIDHEGKLDTMNEAGLKMMELSDISEIKGLKYVDLVDEEDRERIENLLQRAYDGYSSEFEFSLMINDKRRVFTSCFIPMEEKPKGKRRIIGVTQDITERKVSEEELYHSANYDPLTKLRNRPNFLDTANQLIAQASRHHHHLAMLFIDLDNFKPVNDELGHNIGDCALKEVAERLLKVLRKEDIACRYGGDEFVVLLPSVEKIADAKDAALRIMKLLEQPFSTSGLNTGIYASIGISIYPRDGDNSKILITRADEAMYQAKRAGGNQVSFFE